MEICKKQICHFLSEIQKYGVFGWKICNFWSETKKTWGLWVTQHSFMGPLGEEWADTPGVHATFWRTCQVLLTPGLAQYTTTILTPNFPQLWYNFIIHHENHWIYNHSCQGSLWNVVECWRQELQSQKYNDRCHNAATGCADTRLAVNCWPMKKIKEQVTFHYICHHHHHH